MVEAARVVVAITDSSKFGRICLHRIIAAGDLVMLISDTAAPDEISQAIRQQVVQLLLA